MKQLYMKQRVFSLGEKFSEKEVYQNEKFIGAVSKKWFTRGDSYELQIADNGMEPLIVALVVAIDCAPAAQNAAGSGG